MSFIINSSRFSEAVFNRIFMSGEFTSLNGETLRRIAMYDPATGDLTAMGSNNYGFFQRIVKYNPVDNHVYYAGSDRKLIKISVETPSSATTIESSLGTEITSLDIVSNGDVYFSGFTSLTDSTPGDLAVYNGSTVSVVSSTPSLASSTSIFISADPNTDELAVLANYTTGGYQIRLYDTTTDTWGSTIESSATSLTYHQQIWYHSNSDLYVKGFNGGNVVNKWNGSSWSQLGGVFNGDPICFAIDDSGDLYTGGNFTTIGGASKTRIAKWNGSTWSTVGTGANSTVIDVLWNDGTLYAGGIFTQAGGITVNYIAEWNGSAWGKLNGGAGANDWVWCISSTINN